MRALSLLKPVDVKSPGVEAWLLSRENAIGLYEQLKGRGVDFSEQPEERPYGIDSAFRDPSGNHIRLTQVRELAAV